MDCFKVPSRQRDFVREAGGKYMYQQEGAYVQVVPMSKKNGSRLLVDKHQGIEVYPSPPSPYSSISVFHISVP